MIFSDLNNLKVYTILEQPFADRFGITTQELRGLFRRYGIEDRFKEADAWYNGYRFGSHTIFNPWSVLNFIDDQPAPAQPYWANTSSNALIRDLVIGGDLDLRENISKLIAGKTIDSIIDRNIVFPELKDDPAAVYSLFFFSGYLKCVQQRSHEHQLECSLALPNRELEYIFRTIISKWLRQSFENDKLISMLNALVSGRLEQFERLLNEFVLTTLSFFDRPRGRT